MIKTKFFGLFGIIQINKNRFLAKYDQIWLFNSKY